MNMLIVGEIYKNIIVIVISSALLVKYYLLKVVQSGTTNDCAVLRECITAYE